MAFRAKPDAGEIAALVAELCGYAAGVPGVTLFEVSAAMAGPAYDFDPCYQVLPGRETPADSHPVWRLWLARESRWRPTPEEAIEDFRRVYDEWAGVTVSEVTS